MAVLSVRELTKVFRAKSFFSRSAAKVCTAVRAISFQVQEGEIVGLLGANGAGKTTTIHMLLSVLTPTSGTISYFDKNFVDYRSTILQSVGFASTYVKLPSRITVQQNLNIYARLYGLSYQQRHDRIEHYLKFFGVWNLRNRDTGVLSAGETTRVILAKAFLSEPKIVLLDEPTASLDPDVAYDVRKLITRQRREHGTSFLITSHNMSEVSQVCDRVLFMKKGNIIANNTPEQLAQSIATTRVELLVGDGLKRTVQIADEWSLLYKIENRSISIEIDEHKVADLLIALAQKGVVYTQISIAKPTLEDYFLQVTKSA